MSGLRKTRSRGENSTMNIDKQNDKATRSKRVKSELRLDAALQNASPILNVQDCEKRGVKERNGNREREMKKKPQTLSDMYSYKRGTQRNIEKDTLKPVEEIESESLKKDKKIENTVNADLYSHGNDPFLRSLEMGGFEKNVDHLKLTGFKPTSKRSQNMVHCLQQMCLGGKSRLEVQETVKSPVIDVFRDMRVCRVASPFDRRVTAIEWHPTLPNTVAVGSKGGDIMIWNTQTVENDKFIGGIGAAGSCQALKFWPWDTSRVVSASINGTVTLHDSVGKQDVVLADTMDSYDHWFCSLDVNPSRYMVAAGRNGGILHLMSSEGRKIFEYRLHKNKITHVEFSPKEEWLMCTASTDQTVQFWDVRNIKDRKSALKVLKHDKPVNSAYFSRTDGCRLLTTDQKNEIRVYQSPEWYLETTIQHPHRFFQHISPFKATWHPLVDLIICGRYPDKDFPGYHNREPRTLDLFDAKSGEMIAKLHDPEMDGLCPLNLFSNQGDSLVSGMGLHVKLWNRKEAIEKIQEHVVQKHLASDLFSGLPNRQGQSSRSARNQGQGDNNDDGDDLKKKKRRKSKNETDTMSKTKTKVLKKK